MGREGATGGRCSDPQSPRVGADRLRHALTGGQTVCLCEVTSLAAASPREEVLLAALSIHLWHDKRNEEQVYSSTEVDATPAGKAETLAFFFFFFFWQVDVPDEIIFQWCYSIIGAITMIDIDTSGNLHTYIGQRLLRDIYNIYYTLKNWEICWQAEESDEMSWCCSQIGSNTSPDMRWCYCLQCLLRSVNKLCCVYMGLISFCYSHQRYFVILGTAVKWPPRLTISTTHHTVAW